MDSNGTIITNNEYVAVCMDDYDALIRGDLKLDAIKDVLFRSASLSWDKKSLRFDDVMVCHVLQTLCPTYYNSTLKSLQKLEEINGTDKD